MTKKKIDSPASREFRMPAEWERHAATWLAWPHNQETWPENLAEAQSEFWQLVGAIALDESVVIIAPIDQAELMREGINRYDFNTLPIWLDSTPTNDAWIRDYGPTFVKNGNCLIGIDWKYNAWGGKYPPYDLDQQVAVKAIKNMPPHLGRGVTIERFESSLCLEGGAIEINSDGVLMCTRSCALDPNRNPDMTLEKVETELKLCLGATEIIWLTGDAIAGDDTDGHIDQLARFAPGNKIVFTSVEDREDPQFQALDRNRINLIAEIERLNLGYELIALPIPEPIDLYGRRLPASYCNFYITNGSVIVPQFGQPQDEVAIQVLSPLFPKRRVFGLPSSHLTVGLGSFHCLTQQQPDADS